MAVAVTWKVVNGPEQWRCYHDVRFIRNDVTVEPHATYFMEITR